MADQQCPICHSKRAQSNVVPDKIDSSAWQCTACGIFVVTGSAEVILERLQAKDRAILSGVMRRSRSKSPRLFLTSENVARLIASAPAPKDASTFLDNLLLWIADMTGQDRHFFEQVSLPKDLNITLFVENMETVYRGRSQLQELGWLIELGGTPAQPDVQLTAKGWREVERIRSNRPEGWRAFVAMSFREELLPAFTDAIEPALRACGYQAIRVDSLQHNDKIDDRILAELRRCSLVVADCTLHPGGVYFEAGFGLGRGVPVVWTCRSDELSKAHFDTRQYYHVEWRDSSDLREKLIDRLRATVPTREESRPST
jgi:hypothetical protein